MTADVEPGAPVDPEVPEDETEALDYEDLRRCAVLYCDWRSGSHMFKSALEDLGGISSSTELFNIGAGREVDYSFAAYLARPGVDLRALLEQPEVRLAEYFAHCFARLPARRPMLLDVKYTHSYRLGVDDTLQAPVILKKLVDWRVPVVHLLRRDVVSMAISQRIALESGVYARSRWDRDDAQALALEARHWLDPREVLRSARASRRGQTLAHEVLTRLGARVLTLFYEDLVSDGWAAQYRRVFRFLDHYRELPAHFRPRLERLDSVRRVANLDEVLAHVDEADPELLQSYPVRD